MSDLSIVDTHWLETWTGTKLHHAHLTSSALHMLQDFGSLRRAFLDCGSRSEVMVPGVLRRMSTPRCKRCCKLTGLPEGNGSPKNSDECRRLLGMDPL
jgi:hypothetical protein